MHEFPKGKLVPKFATIFEGQLGETSIEIHFEPFLVAVDKEMPDDYFLLEKPVRADFVDIPSSNVLNLQNQSFEFPINPAEGYIDGSIYLMTHHNPVGITKIVFGGFCNGHVEMKVISRWLMSFEATGFNDFDYISLCQCGFHQTDSLTVQHEKKLCWTVANTIQRTVSPGIRQRRTPPERGLLREGNLSYQAPAGNCAGPPGSTGRSGAQKASSAIRSTTS